MSTYVLSAFADEAAADLQEQMRICRDNAIKWIEMRGVNGKNLSDYMPEEAIEVKKQLDEKGFRVSSIGSPFGKIGINDDFAPHLEKFKRNIEIAHILEAKYMRIFSFYIPKDEEPDNYKDNVIERLSKFLDNADGVMLCHENEKGIFGDMPCRNRTIYEAFKGKIRLIFDPANYIQCGAPIQKGYEYLHDAIEYFHIKDGFFKDGSITPAGRGDGEIEWLLNSFAEKNKTAFLSVEPHLKVFDGFSALENGEKSIKEEYSYRSNEEAFSTAVMALQAILCANSFRQTKDIEKGYGEWIR